MNSLVIQLLPAIVALLPLFLIFSMVAWSYHHRRRRRNPLTYQMLRAPGESISQRIEKLSEDIALHFMGATALPLYIYSAYVTNRYLAHEKTSLAFFIFLGVVGVVFVAFRLNKLIAQRRNEFLGLDCERAVGQELNQLMLEGCRVYHDFMAEEFNIDHIVIGANGVFAIETKGRAKSNDGKGPDDVRVIYDGQMLQFPTWREQKPIEQAKRQATWLSNWLTSAVGEKIPVTPALALAGWFIERKQKGLLIFNGKNPSFIAKLPTESSFSPEMVQRIAHQIEQRCRNVEPQAYRKEKK